MVVLMQVLVHCYFCIATSPLVPKHSCWRVLPARSGTWLTSHLSNSGFSTFPSAIFLKARFTAQLQKAAVSAELEGAVSCEIGTQTLYDSTASEDSVLSLQPNIRCLSFHWLWKQLRKICFPKVKLAFICNPYFSSYCGYFEICTLIYTFKIRSNVLPSR